MSSTMPIFNAFPNSFQSLVYAPLSSSRFLAAALSAAEEAQCFHKRLIRGQATAAATAHQCTTILNAVHMCTRGAAEVELEVAHRHIEGQRRCW